MMRAVLIEGAIGGAVLSLVSFLLSRFVGDIVGRTLLATVLFAAAGAYFGFAFEERVPRIWVLIELLQCLAVGTLGLYGWRGNAKWLALGWALHPLWDFVVHYVGPGRAFARGLTRLRVSRSIGSSRLMFLFTIAEPAT